MTKQYIVEGMTCMHCKMRVETAIKKVAGVKQVEIDLAKKSVIVDMKKEIADQVFADVVSQAGYTLKVGN